MAKRGNNSWKELLPAIGLIVLVFGILGLSALVRSEPEPETTIPEPDGVDRPALLIPPTPEIQDQTAAKTGDTTAAEPAPVPAESGRRSSRISGRKMVGLDERARQDYDRLTGMSDRWTWQLMVSCDRENSLRHVKAIGWADDLYVLPTELKGRNCYRLCWGLYDDREQAESDTGLPPYLVENFQERRPKSLAEIRP